MVVHLDDGVAGEGENVGIAPRRVRIQLLDVELLGDRSGGRRSARRGSGYSITFPGPDASPIWEVRKFFGSVVRVAVPFFRPTRPVRMVALSRNFALTRLLCSAGCSASFGSIRIYSARDALELRSEAYVDQDGEMAAVRAAVDDQFGSSEKISKARQ